jgi:REP element-mobilizing transposase RayT
VNGIERAGMKRAGIKCPRYKTAPDKSGLSGEKESMPYWQLFYHFVWATKLREPLLTPDIESLVYATLRTKAIGLGANVFALNGTVDHVHLVVSVPPKLALATFIGQVKGVAATRFNKVKSRELPLFWQDEYGVFSLDAKRLPHAVAYVERQKEHHADNSVIPILERMDDAGVRQIREATEIYTTGEDHWRREMLSLSDDK